MLFPHLWRSGGAGRMSVMAWSGLASGLLALAVGIGGGLGIAVDPDGSLFVTLQNGIHGMAP